MVLFDILFIIEVKKPAYSNTRVCEKFSLKSQIAECTYLYPKEVWRCCNQTLNFVRVAEAMEYCGIVLLPVCHTHLEPVVSDGSSIAGWLLPLDDGMMR